MSKISNNGKYITLDEVRVYFNEKTQMIEITLKDDDVTSKTLDKNPTRILASLTTKHGRALYDALEEKQNEQADSQEEQSSEPKVEYLYPIGPLPALRDFSVLDSTRPHYIMPPDTTFVSLATFVSSHNDPATSIARNIGKANNHLRQDSAEYQNHTVLLGQRIDEASKSPKNVFWNWNQQKNCIILGKPQTGKTELARNIVAHCKNRKSETQIIISENYIDGVTNGQYYATGTLPNKQFAYLLNTLEEMTKKRIALLGEENSPVGYLKPVVVILDSLSLLQRPRNDSLFPLTNEEYDLKRRLLSLISLANRANIHFVIINEYLTKDTWKIFLHDNNSLQVVMGVDGTEQNSNILPAGKGVYQFSNRNTRSNEDYTFQSYSVPREIN